MSVTLIATPKDPTANCYIDEATATAFLTNTRPSAEVAVWSALSADERSRFLIMAARILDQCMTWEGMPTTITQVLQWPRVAIRRKGDLGFYDANLIPDIIQEATAEFALMLSQRDRLHEPGIFGKGLSELMVGPIRMYVDKSAVLPLIPTYILNLLRFVGSVSEISADEGAGRVVPLVRA